MKLIVIFVTFSVLVIPFLIYILISRTAKVYRTAKQKFSDRSLMGLLAQNNGMLSTRQIVQNSPLTMTEASLRIHNWSNNGCIRSLYSGDGLTTYFQLKTTVPNTSKIYDWHTLSEQEALTIVLSHIEGYKLSLTDFIWLFDMSIQEARTFLKKLATLNLVKSHYNNHFQRVYISNLDQQGTLRFSGNEQVKIPDLEPVDEGRMKIEDSEILKLAIENDGRLTPTLICVEKKIPLDDAQDLLDKLYSKGAFHIEVDEYDGMIEYWLRDSKLYKK